jgi:hypothetical protein
MYQSIVWLNKLSFLVFGKKRKSGRFSLPVFEYTGITSRRKECLHAKGRCIKSRSKSFLFLFVVYINTHDVVRSSKLLSVIR